MSDRVYELFQEQKKGELTSHFLYDAFEEMMKKEKTLSDYIEDFRIMDIRTEEAGYYLPDNKCIKIDKNKINRKLRENQTLFGLEIVRHEMEHARNYEILEKGKDDIESLVISLALRGYAMKKGIDRRVNIDHLYPDFLIMDTRMHYKINPAERLAEIKAWRYMVNLLKNQRREEDIILARKMLASSYRRGYHDNRYYLDAPTMEFLLKTGMFHEFYWLKNRMEKKDYSFDTRITLGLPVSREEYDKKIYEKAKRRWNR